MLWNDPVKFEEKVDLVGISYRITAEKKAFSIADEFRKRGITVVAGGPQPTGTPYDAAEHFDAVVVGEGEGLWPTLLVITSYSIHYTKLYELA